MKAKSICANSTEEITKALENCIAEGFNPTLAFVFTSLKEQWQEIQAFLSKEIIALFGATTAGEFTEHGLGDTGITLLLLDINPQHFIVILKDNELNSPCEVAGEIAKAALNSFSNPAFIILATHTKTPADDIIAGIVEKVGANATIIGGMAGNAINLQGTIFTNNTFSENGILCLVLDQDRIEVKGVAISGWKPLGTEKKVTKSEGFWIHTIDNKPALDIVEKYIGNDSLSENGVDNMVRLNTTYPLQVNRNGSSPAMIPTLFYNKETSAVMCGQV